MSDDNKLMLKEAGFGVGTPLSPPAGAPTPHSPGTWMILMSGWASVLARGKAPETHVYGGRGGGESEASAPPISPPSYC